MQFFIPGITDASQTEEIYEKTKTFAEMQLGGKVEERRIFSMTVDEHGEPLHVEVGKIAPNGEPVFAILDTGNFLICTPNQGVFKGLPAIVSAQEATDIVEFG